MTGASTSSVGGLSRRLFVEAAGSNGLLGLAGCTATNLDDTNDRSWPPFVYASAESLQREEVYDDVECQSEEAKTDAIKHIGDVPWRTDSRDSNLEALDEMTSN
jgi:hypothetical protein